MVPVVSQINSHENKMKELTDEQLKDYTRVLKDRYNKGIEQDRKEYDALREKYNSSFNNEEKSDLNNKIDEAEEKYRKIKQDVLSELLPEAFAVVRETSWRVLKMRHFDVQMVGGIVLNGGNIAEMTTGEGKTLCATLPAYLNALTGEGVHVVTVNDYLAKRDMEWMGPIYKFLGLTVGVILHDMVPGQRQQAYGCDITYGTNNEFGFDYLRDNMVSFKDQMVQRQHHFAIVDEVDSILVDEARTPLIISGPSEVATDKYYKAFEISKILKGRRITEGDEIDAKHKEIDLTVGFDYLADEKNKSIAMTEAGEEKAAKTLGIANLHDMETIEHRHHILAALKAKEFFQKDVDYVVQEGEVIIVDEFTGRMMPGRRWSDGLHQAVEAKEGIKIERESQTLSTITFQNYFRLYEKLSGMTGTAYTEATEFKQIYKLDCVAIPTNKKLQRMNYADSIYKTQKEKYNAVVTDIGECHKRGQPVLVGTISIEKSELLSTYLKQKGIPHNVLNAKFHLQEAHIIAQAGRFGAVTIATNMAGRGTDIVLGGNAGYLAANLVSQKLREGADEAERTEMTQKFISQFKEQCQVEQKKVLEQGGLYVLGTERHESRRIDNQLRGRQGRQGDPGASKFYVSLEDDLMRLFASDRIIGFMDKLGMEEGQVLEHPWLNKALENAQKRVENHNFEIRKHLLEYDDVMNRQREVVYDLRRLVLESSDIKYLIFEAIQNVISPMVNEHLFTARGDENAWNFDGLNTYLKTAFHYDMSAHKDQLEGKPQEEILQIIMNDLNNFYSQREKEFGAEAMRSMERMLMLNTIDSKWKDHLYAMDLLKEGIGLRSYGQRDPLVEYKKEGFFMFETMHASINQEVAELILKLQPVSPGHRIKSVFGSLPQNLVHDEAQDFRKMTRTAASSSSDNQLRPPEVQKIAPARNEGPKVGRNDLCPCGSGKKYKKCCGE
ncbi:MAG: preprotein translocase subunit SecA [Candidatus Omnitrophica bacterium]|nr:preprotein translocase subunit SecA [Candidatus Omnitrophota bacterium]